MDEVSVMTCAGDVQIAHPVLDQYLDGSFAHEKHAKPGQATIQTRWNKPRIPTLFHATGQTRKAAPYRGSRFVRRNP
jgi:hypothetical protein